MLSTLIRSLCLLTVLFRKIWIDSPKTLINYCNFRARFPIQKTAYEITLADLQTRRRTHIFLDLKLSTDSTEYFHEPWFLVDKQNIVIATGMTPVTATNILVKNQVVISYDRGFLHGYFVNTHFHSENLTQGCLYFSIKFIPSFR